RDPAHQPRGGPRMKLWAAGALCLASLHAGCAAQEGDFVERYDTLYNSLTIERRGSVVELRARSRRGEYLESAVDLADPLRLVVPYTRTLYTGLLLAPEPERVLIAGLGGAGFHRLFAHAFPETELHSVELDGKVLELAKTQMGFQPAKNTPVTIMDGRLFVKRNREQWDWIILDAFRGGFVPPHLKTQEFYRECAARLTSRGVFISNLHATTQLYYADLKTIASVFKQVALFRTTNRGNVIALAVNYDTPDINDPANWADAEIFEAIFGEHLDLAAIRREHISMPASRVEKARVMTDDFAPVEFLNTIEINNTGGAR
ncbi:MAG: spermidine synthase, partial [Opitutaceae bacterium]